jgi:cytochrome P450
MASIIDTPLTPAAWGALAIGLATAYLALYWHATRPLDSREPPVAPSALPYAGHLLGMLLRGGRYLKALGQQQQSAATATPIFALATLPGSPRVYVVTEPALAAAVQRASRALSFTPLIPDVTERVLGLDGATAAVVRRHLDPAPGAAARGFLADIQDMVYARLGPGDYLGELSREAAAALRDEVHAYRRMLVSSAGDSSGGGDAVDLLEWVRHLVTTATARYLYGPANPLAADAALEQAFWDFDHGLGMLLLNVLPSITARRAYIGRERLVAALADYLEAGTYRTGSRIIQERVELALQHGWAIRAVARSELSFLFAGIVNATTSTFWIALQLFADPALLTRVRQEIEAVVITRDGDCHSGEDNEDKLSGGDVLSVEDLKTRCPMLVAVYRECLRLNSDNNSVRVVKEPTLLADRWYLAPGSIVQIAGGVIHSDPTIWGSNVDQFDPNRFLTGQQQVHPAAFRAFGGGKTLCPGRHFAMNEILSLVAMIVLYFDMDPSDGSERIKVPRKNDGVLPVHILEPVEPVKVIIRPRPRKDVSIVLGKT